MLGIVSVEIERLKDLTRDHELAVLPLDRCLASGEFTIGPVEWAEKTASPPMRSR